MSEIAELFGAAIRRRRERMGLSQEAFAAKAAVHRTYMSAIELGKVQVSIGIAQQLCNALDVPMSKIWKEIESNATAE
jgi:transcriptional regulator with XRE-family HTH domain